MVAVNVGHEHVVDIGWLEADGLESLAQFRLARVRPARPRRSKLVPALEEVGGDVFSRARERRTQGDGSARERRRLETGCKQRR